MRLFDEVNIQATTHLYAWPEARAFAVRCSLKPLDFLPSLIAVEASLIGTQKSLLCRINSLFLRLGNYAEK